jgi:hypothetical protein
MLGTLGKLSATEESRTHSHPQYSADENDSPQCVMLGMHSIAVSLMFLIRFFQLLSLCGCVRVSVLWGMHCGACVGGQSRLEEGVECIVERRWLVSVWTGVEEGSRRAND